MEGILGPGVRSLFTERRRKRPRRLGSMTPCESVGAGTRERQGCQRFGRLGARGRRTPRENPESPPKRAGRRETPGSPVSWSRVHACEPRARRESRRDAGSSRGAGARVWKVGKQKSVVRITPLFRGGPQGEPRTQRDSSKQIATPLTRRAASPKKGARFGRSRTLTGKARGQLPPQRRVYKHAPERTGARSALRALKTRGSKGFDLVRHRKVLGPRGWNAMRAGSSHGKAARRKASWVVPPFSLAGSFPRAPVRP